MEITTAKVLVTGGSSGIGYETARLLRERGATVVICGTNEAVLPKAASALNVFARRADVSSPADVEALFSYAIEQMDGLNVLINNAGIGYFAPLVETKLEAFQRVWEVNVKGAFLAGQLAARHFVRENYGNIVNIASTAAQRGSPNGTAYVASKFALSGMTECWRAELRKYNVRVMQVNPSEVVTEFFARAGDRSGQSNPEKKLRPSEVAHVILDMLTMRDVGFVTDATVWATNPW